MGPVRGAVWFVFVRYGTLWVSVISAWGRLWLCLVRGWPCLFWSCLGSGRDAGSWFCSSREARWCRWFVRSEPPWHSWRFLGLWGGDVVVRAQARRVLQFMTA